MKLPIRKRLLFTVNDSAEKSGTPPKSPDQWRDQVFDQGLNDGAKGNTDHDRHRKVNHVAAQNKFPKPRSCCPPTHRVGNVARMPGHHNAVCGRSRYEPGADLAPFNYYIAMAGRTVGVITSAARPLYASGRKPLMKRNTGNPTSKKMPGIESIRPMWMPKSSAIMPTMRHT